MAVILFAHGARKASWATPFESLQQEISAQLPEQKVCLAYLELMQPSLELVVEELAAEGESEIVIMPLFLSKGGHIINDLPKKVEQLSAQFPNLCITILPVLMELPEIQTALVKSIIRVSS